MTLGEFGWFMDSQTGTNGIELWIFFIFGTFFMLILMLNVLVAIMGDTYGRVTETKDSQMLK